MAHNNASISVVIVSNQKPRSRQHDQGSALLSLKLIPELSAAALKARLDKELALWYELRAINVIGSGRLLLNDALAALVQHFGYSEKTVYRLLKAGKGKFWDIHGSSLSGGFRGRSVVKIYGLYQVAEHLNASGLSRPVEIRVSDFGGRGVKSAWLYAVFFKPVGSRAKPISRASIEAATGVLRRQQQRYDNVARINKQPNFALQQDGEGNLTPIRHLVEGKCKQWLKDRRLGNTYHSRAVKAPRGMTKKVNALLRHRFFNSDEASCVPRRFFFTPRSLIRSPERHDESFLIMKESARLVKGRVEWCLV